MKGQGTFAEHAGEPEPPPPSATGKAALLSWYRRRSAGYAEILGPELGVTRDDVARATYKAHRERDWHVPSLADVRRHLNSSGPYGSRR